MTPADDTTTAPEGDDTLIGNAGADTIAAPEATATTDYAAAVGASVTSEAAEPLTTEQRIEALEHAVRVLTARLLGPNGGGDQAADEAAALYANLFGAEA